MASSVDGRVTPPTGSVSPGSEREFVTIESEAEATDLIYKLLSRQLSRAAHERVAPNQHLNGDSDLRRAFWMLLSPQTQRTLFLSMCKRREFWPRIRSCVGSPPFSFLMPTDNYMLNPGGITTGRTNMASTNRISTSVEIAKGQFVDSHKRHYKWITDDNTNSTQIPDIRVRSAKRVVLDVCVPKMGLDSRRQLMKRSHGREKGLHYPKPGETLHLTPDSALGGGGLLLIVRTVESRGVRSPVARIYCIRQ